MIIFMSKIVIANWKMNLPDLNQVTEYLLLPYDNVIIAAPNIILAAMTAGRRKIQLAAQNFSHLAAKSGSYTGEVSAEMLAKLRVNHSLIGHYERRKYFNEDAEQIKQKLSFAGVSGITPILCLSASEKPVNAEHEIELITKELLNYNNLNLEQIIIAYEPAFAINSQDIASEDFITEVTINLKLQAMALKLAKNVKILYGGSVNLDNIAKLEAIKGLDGYLIGRASLNFEEFSQICKLVS